MKKVMRLISKTIVDVGLPHLVRNDDQFEVRLPRPACAGLAMTSVDRRDDDVRGRNDKRRGFSLIELMVGVSIIAVLATVGMVSYRSANARARDSRREADVQQIRAALEMYRTDNGVYPNDLATLTTTPAYMSADLLLDPDGVAYTYPNSGVPASGTYVLCYTPETHSDGCRQNPL